MPQLEIYADDVQATHGATTGQLDETAIFYMQQRGIGELKARKMLIGAFVKDIIDRVDVNRIEPHLANQIRQIEELLFDL